MQGHTPLIQSGRLHGCTIHHPKSNPKPGVLAAPASPALQLNGSDLLSAIEYNVIREDPTCWRL
jgi:hypothetical protein